MWTVFTPAGTWQGIPVSVLQFAEGRTKTSQVSCEGPSKTRGFFLSFEAHSLTPANCQVALVMCGQAVQRVKHLFVTGHEHLGSKGSLSSHQLSLAPLHLRPAQPDPEDLFPVEPAVPSKWETRMWANF